MGIGDDRSGDRLRLAFGPPLSGNVASVDGAREPDVVVIVLRYNGDPAPLAKCVESVVTDASDSDLHVDILLVDNGSTSVPNAVRECAALHDNTVSTLMLEHNHGFAGGVNRGIAHSGGEFVFLLNDDATLDPGALRSSVDTLRSAPSDVVAVATKMVLASDPFILDGVGIAVNGRGEAFNRGLGQPDIGQYDQSEECLGPCFGAALVRRTAFATDMVGLLDESYFLYYEDVEWSWRATLMGWRTITAPQAVVRHHMSSSSRADSYAFKHRFIERNLLASVARCFGFRRAVVIWARRWPALVKGRITGEFPKASGGAAFDAARRLPFTLMARRRIQRRRRTSDDHIIAFSLGERTFFDPVSYLPQRSMTALAVAAQRRVDKRTDDSTDDSQRWRALAIAAAGVHTADAQRAVRELAVSSDKRLGPYVDAAVGTELNRGTTSRTE